MVFAHRTPEETGVDSRDILSLLNNIEQSIHCPDALMVVKDGAIIAQGYWAPFEENDKHILQSASKSFTGLAVGLLVKDGKLSLDERLADIFPEYVSEFTSERAKRITVRDLLTMSASNAKTPAIFTNLKTSWIQSYLSFLPAHEPGTHFCYDTGASVMLSAIVSRKTGQSLHSFLQKRVFIPMGIYSAEWSYLPEKTPEGVPISFGGCGLSISMPDWAKFAQMLLDGGCWEGKQLLPPDWIAQATQKQIDNQNNDMDAWGDGYGYQIWLGPDNIYMFYGSYGQYLLCAPDKKLFVLTFASCTMQQGPLLAQMVLENILQKAKNTPLPPNLQASQALCQRLKGLSLPVLQGKAQAAGEKEHFSRAYVFFGNNRRHLRSVEFLRLDEKTIALKMDIYDRHITVKAAFGAYARERLVLPRDIEYNAILQGNDNITQAFCYAWEDDNTLKITHSVVNSLSIDYYTFVFDKNGVRVDISANAYYDGLQEESFLSIP